MSNHTYPIVGIPVQQGKPLPVRQEITAWASDPANLYQVSLFIYALKCLKEKPVDDMLGFYQVAGRPDPSDEL